MSSWVNIGTGERVQMGQGKDVGGRTRDRGARRRYLGLSDPRQGGEEGWHAMTLGGPGRD